LASGQPCTFQASRRPHSMNPECGTLAWGTQDSAPCHRLLAACSLCTTNFQATSLPPRIALVQGKLISSCSVYASPTDKPEGGGGCYQRLSNRGGLMYQEEPFWAITTSAWNLPPCPSAGGLPACPAHVAA